jgi:DNA-binding transcriptional MerR regulator
VADVTVRDVITELPTASLVEEPPTKAPPLDLPVGSDEVLSIAEAAQRLGVSAHALRYYERIGLLDVPRDAAGRRRYTSADIARAEFVNCLRKTDLPISRIQEYFELVDAGPHTSPQRLELLEAHRQEVCRRKADLESALAMVEYKITLYGGDLAPAYGPKQPGTP